MGHLNLGSSLLNAGSSLFSSVMNFAGLMYQNKESKKATKEANWQQKALLDYQNAYNTPAAQMARYEEAGLNPNLIYGQSNLSAGASSVPQRSVPSGYGTLGDRFIDRLYAAKKLGQDIQIGQEQINQIRANTELLREQAKLAGANKDVIDYELAGTPSGFSSKDRSGVAAAARFIKNAKDQYNSWLDKQAAETRKHQIDPSLPALGRNRK